MKRVHVHDRAERRLEHLGRLAALVVLCNDRWVTEIVKVQFRDAMRGEWTAEIDDATGSTTSHEGVTQVFGQRVDSGRGMTQLAAFPDDSILGVTFEKEPSA